MVDGNEFIIILMVHLLAVSNSINYEVKCGWELTGCAINLGFHFGKPQY